MNKPRLGFFKYSCCAGCEFQTFYFQKHLAETLAAFDIVYAKMVLRGGAPEGPFDLALVEGTITEAWQVDELKKVRKNSTLLFAIGACAVNGGIPAIKALAPELEVEEKVYKDLSTIHSIRPQPINVYVPVDGYIRGCPPGARDLYEALTSVLAQKKPGFLTYSVCVECKLERNICILVAYGMPCMGPVTNAGCGALCPTYKRPCYSCFGAMKQANAPALAHKFRKLGLSEDDIRRKFTMFDANSAESRKAADFSED
ncbi:MAG: oxidoreductase [Nitrospirae bacterium]|nr:oxidoreductase [Nitrospirota bacterium]MCL5236946.1 oxidoreductase [Nitrospirota bacterium]